MKSDNCPTATRTEHSARAASKDANIWSPAQSLLNDCAARRQENPLVTGVQGLHAEKLNNPIMVNVRILGEVSEGRLRLKNGTLCLTIHIFIPYSSSSNIDHRSSCVVGTLSNQCYVLLRIPFGWIVCKFVIDHLDSEI